MYLNEHKVTKLSDTALMTDEFVLIHQSSVHLNELSRSKLSISVKNRLPVSMLCQLPLIIPQSHVQKDTSFVFIVGSQDIKFQTELFSKRKIKLLNLLI